MMIFISILLAVLSFLIIGYTYIKSRSRENISISDIDGGIICYICKEKNEFIPIDWNNGNGNGQRIIPGYSYYEQYKKRACKSCQRDMLLDNVLSNNKLSIKNIIPNNYCIFGIVYIITSIFTIIMTSFFPKVGEIGEISSASILLIGSIFIHYGYMKMSRKC